MISYFQAIELYYLIKKLENYEPGIVRKIAKLCGIVRNISREQFYLNWMPLFKELSLMDMRHLNRLSFEDQKKVCKSRAIYDGTFLDYIKMVSNVFVTSIWNDEEEESDNDERLINGIKHHYKDWGLYDRTIKIIQNIDAKSYSLIIYPFIKNGDLIPDCSYTIDNVSHCDYKHSMYYLKHSAPHHCIEIIPNNVNNKVIIKGIFVDTLIRKKKMCLMTTKTTGSSFYVKTMNEYFDKINEDL